MKLLALSALALAAAANHAHVEVVGRPLVAIIATGDELLPPGSVTGRDQIIASNNFGVAAIAYHALRFWRGPFLDEEMVTRNGGGFASRGVKHFFAWTMRPFWTVLARVGFPPNAITSLKS